MFMWPTLEANITSETTFAASIKGLLASEDHYAAIRNQIESWWRPDLRFDPSTVTTRGCVAFISTVLRMAAVPIPTKIRSTTTRQDLTHIRSPSLLVSEFVQFAIGSIGWDRIDDWKLLQFGDLVVTSDHKNGRLDHITLFSCWVDPLHGVAEVVDNQRFRYERPLFTHHESTISPFAFFIRPENKGLCDQRTCF
jgi:hypothetical protein